jgi:hypothetical protein
LAQEVFDWKMFSLQAVVVGGVAAVEELFAGDAVAMCGRES